MMRVFELIDPRPTAAEAPYTFFLPLPSTLDAVECGDLVKIVVQAVPPSEHWNAERVWVIVSSVDDTCLAGELDSSPSDIPGLERGTRIEIPRTHVIDVLFKDETKSSRVPKDYRRWYWERCLVDDCILKDGVLVQYLYREEPLMGQKDGKDPDSGWRIRGDRRNCTGDELEARKASFVALGAVLNRDDSWLHLIDEPIGSAFDRDFETGEYIPSD